MTQSPDYLRGGGEMGALMRAHDWSASSLGSPEKWHSSLRAMVRLILNTGHPMYIFWGEDGACLYNDAYRASIGPERHPGSLGRPGQEVWAEIWPIIGPQIKQVMSGQGATWNENHLVPITRYGKREDVYWTYSHSPIDDPEAPHGVGGVLVVCTETTQQVILSRRLTAERDQLGALFEQAPTFMVLLRGPKHVVEIANPSYLKLIGDRPLVGLPIAQALPEAAKQGYIELLDRVYATGEAYQALGAKYDNQQTTDGPVETRYLDFVYQPVRGPDGQVNGIFVGGADVTARTQADEALRASEARYRELSEQLSDAHRRKDEFLATLAHELRNPLAPIRHALTMQRLAVGDPKVVAKSCELIERQVSQLVRLIDDLFDVMRLNRGMVELRRTRVAFATALSEAVETSRPLMEQSKHALSVSLPVEPLFIDADSTRVVQVFSNLLNNAARFTAPCGRIELVLSRESDAAVVRVRDDGQGIAPEMLEGIFDMFTQVERSHTRVNGGLGIGLTLVRRMVELHGGRVEACSAGLGKGSEFIVRWPLAAESAKDVAIDAPEPSPSREAARRRILVADDNKDASESLAMALDIFGHETRVAHDGEEAYGVAQEFRPHVMMLDIAMPRLDGHALARRVRAQPWGADVLLIAISGWGQPDDLKRSREAGFDHHLVKPLAFEKIDQLLGTKA